MFRLWLLFLPWCFGINEFEGIENVAGSSHQSSDHSAGFQNQQFLEAMLNNDNFVTINGKRTSLNAIYGNIELSTANFKPGNKLLSDFDSKRNVIISSKLPDVSTMCACGAYVEREFSVRYAAEIRLSQILQVITDTPTVIALEIGQQMHKITPQPLLLIGDPRAGKSVALAKIRHKLHQIHPYAWSVQVPVTDMYGPATSVNEITFENIVERKVGEGVLDLFYNLLEVNPKRIIFLFDGVDRMTDEQGSKIASIIKTVVDKRAGVIVTGRKHTVELLKDQIDMNIYEIGEMTLGETKKFLTHAWNRDIQKVIGALEIRTDFDTQLKRYVNVFTNVLFKTQLPRQPVPLMILAETFSRQSSPLLLSTDNTYPVGCIDFVFHPTPSLANLVVAMEQVILDKNGLYQSFVNALADNSNDLEHHYGAIALAEIISVDEGPLLATQFLHQFGVPFMTIKLLLMSQIESATFINLINAEQLEFVHPELRNFYAARFIMTWMTEFPMSVVLWQKVLLGSHYHGVLEFLNFQVKDRAPTMLPIAVSSSGEPRFDIMSNIIINRFDSMFHHIYDNYMNMIDLDKLQKYFLYTHYIVEKPNRVFGMTRSTLPHPDPNPFEPSTSSQDMHTPLELLVKQNMLQACERLQLTGVWFPKVEEVYIYHYHYLLQYAVTRPIPNIKLVDFLVKHTIAISTNYLNKLLYDTINGVGSRGRPVAEYLVKLGAYPATTKVNGRTLLHEAPKWNDVNLLRYLLNDLKVSAIDTVDDSGVTVFAAALDANPSPLFTFGGWWEMMSYLVQHVQHLSIVSSEEHVDPELFSIPKEDIVSPWFTLLTCGSNNIDINLQNIDARVVTIRLSQYDHSLNQQHLLWPRFVPYNMWPLSPNTLALRRNFWIHNLHQQGITMTSPLEMLIYYRGVIPLALTEHHHYRTTVMFLLGREGQYLTTKQSSRILNALCENIGNVQDFYIFNSFVEYFVQNGLLTTSNMAREILRRTVGGRLKISNHIAASGIQSIRSNFLSLRDRLLQQRFNYEPIIENSEISHHMLRLLKFLDSYVITNPRPTNPAVSISDSDVPSCLSHRFRRHNFFMKNCYISWEDVDPFNDAVERRVIAQIRINSDDFVHELAAIEYNDARKAQQLVSLVRQLQNGPGDTLVITGRSRMIVRDLLLYGSLTAYRKNQRAVDVINDFKKSLPSSHGKLRFTLPLPSRTVALYAASSVPIIRALHATLAMCLQYRNNTDNNACLYSSGALVLSAGSTTLGTTSAKFMPWMIDRVSRTAIDFLPATAPRILRENIKLMRYFGLKYGLKTMGVGLGIVGVGFDLYNIIEMSKMIDMCSREKGACLNKNKIEYIISLTFSCVSIGILGGMMVSGIGFVPGLLIGLGLLAVEEFSKGINDVIYYNNNYDTTFGENFRIFWHTVGFQPPPEDVQALVYRTDWIKSLHQGVTELLELSNDNVVAYGIGLGMMTSSGIAAGYGFINMESVRLDNTKGLSRVLPTAIDNTTLLCLPRQEINEVYDKYEKTVPDAVYRCKNTFVIAHKQRWKKRSSRESYIVYELENIKTGEIIGSSTLNNLFLINNSTRELSVIGGTGNITNMYMIRNDAFRGNIILHGQPSKNILDLSRINQSIVTYSWTPRCNLGRVQFGSKKNNAFHLALSSSMTPNLHIIGRPGKSDKFICHCSKQPHSADNPLSMIVDGGGGESSLKMDYVIDCNVNIVRPFTNIRGSKSTKSTYRAYVWLDHGVKKTKTVHSSIKPKKSKFIVIFTNRPIFDSSLSVKYVPHSNTLIWKLQYTDSLSLLLSILPYRSSHSTSQQNTTSTESGIETVNCIFIDSFFGSTVYPVINLPDNQNSAVTIEYFNVFATINSSRLEVAVTVYINMNILRKQEFYVVTKLSYPKTGQTFTFGSSMSDRFYIDANTTFILGGDGPDVYVMNNDSPSYVWLDNEASDNALDTLIIPDTICDSIRAVSGSRESNCCDSSRYYDVTLFCSLGTTRTSQGYHVVLRHYLLGMSHRHLQIYWRDATYILLPHQWTKQYQIDDDNGANEPVELALLLSFGEEWQFSTLTLTSRDTYVVLNVSQATNPFVAYTSGSNDLVLARKYLNQDSSSFVLLQDFFSNDTNGPAVSNKWHHLKIFIVDDIISDDTTPTALTANDILNLFFDTILDDANNTRSNVDFIKEYFINMSAPAENHTIIIEHNTAIKDDYQLGVLMVVGAKPGEFYAAWDDSTYSLSLCARQNCIVIKNWCDSIRHRLYRIEFVSTLKHEPVVIRHLNQLKCRPSASSSNNDQLIKQFNHKFSMAQKRFLLAQQNDDNDDARLMRCIGSIIADNIAHESMYEAFGFASVTDQISFIRDNCNDLFTRKNLENLSSFSMDNMFRNRIHVLKLSDITKNDKKTIKRLKNIRKCFTKIDRLSWQDYKSSLYNFNITTQTQVNMNSFKILDERARILSRCV